MSGWMIAAKIPMRGAIAHSGSGAVSEIAKFSGLSMFQSCTPDISTPAANKSEARANASAVNIRPSCLPKFRCVLVRHRNGWKITGASFDVAELTGSSRAVIQRLAKIESITDATPVIDREYNISAAD